MTLPDATTLEALAPSLINGLHRIGVLSQSSSMTATAALGAIARVYQTLRAGLTGELTPETVNKALESLMASIEENDTIADAELAAKFDNSEKA